jgi:hypothetical protein
MFPMCQFHFRGCRQVKISEFNLKRSNQSIEHTKRAHFDIKLWLKALLQGIGYLYLKFKLLYNTMFRNNFLILALFVHNYLCTTNFFLTLLLNLMIFHLNVSSTQKNSSFRWYCNPIWLEEFTYTADVRVNHVLVKQEISHPFRYNDIHLTSYLFLINIFGSFLNKLKFISESG